VDYDVSLWGGHKVLDDTGKPSREGGNMVVVILLVCCFAVPMTDLFRKSECIESVTRGCFAVGLGPTSEEGLHMSSTGGMSGLAWWGEE
jgi:hypothetical protein